MRKSNASLFLALTLVAGGALAACGDDLPAMIDAPIPDAAVDGGPDAAADASVDAEVADARPDAMPVDMDIRDIQMQVVPTGSAVRVVDVVVTARGDAASSSVLFVQEPTGTAPWSGVFVFIDTSPPPPYPIPSRGDLVTIQGTVLEFTRMGMPGSRTNIDMVSNVTINGTAAIPAPALVQESDLVFADPDAEQWEGVLVRVEGVTVASQDPFGEFTLTGGLKVDDRLFAYTQPAAGDSFAAISGPMDHDFGTSRILPRELTDLEGLVPGPPVLIGLSPPSISVGEGMAVTYTVTLDRPAPVGGTLVAVDTSDPIIAAAAVTDVTVLATQTTATFDVTALTFGGPIDVTASLDAVTLTATMTVLAGPDPLLLGVTPDPINVLAGGGTAILVAQLDRVAPAGGTVVTLSSTDSVALIMPPDVTVPAGESSAGFRVRAESAVAVPGITLTATIASGSVTSTVNIVTAPSVPATGDLIVNEVNYDVPASGGDSNCDGVSSSTEQADEFLELTNFTDSPLDLTGATISDSTALRFTFPTFRLGSGESLVVFGGLLGTMTGLHPWCTNTDGSHIGDARAFAGAPLGLNNTGDTVTIVLGATTLDTVTFGSGSDESETRSPDFTGAFSKHTLAPGHATDRNWTPGTLLTGAFLALANPTPPPPPPDAGIPDADLTPDAPPPPDADLTPDAEIPDAGPPADPAVTGLSPLVMNVLAGGGTGILEVTIDVPAPTGGAIVTLSSTDPTGMVVPAQVVVPAGQTSAGFRVRGDAAGTITATITATRNGSAAAMVGTVLTATAPTTTGQLVINEFLSDPPPTVAEGGDANCNGVRGSTDEFVEIVNRSGLPLDLTGVSFWDSTARITDLVPLFTFGALTLGPGEVVLIFAGAPGTTGTSPWCITPVPATAGRIGDAAAFNTPGGILSLNNTGDTISLTTTTSPTSTDLALETYGGEYDTNQSGTRSPDYTGAFIPFTTAPGRAADRTLSPGSRLTGVAFSSANP